MKREQKTLLLEKEVETKTQIEVKTDKQVETEKTFSKQQNIVVETPNYDLMPEITPQKKKRVLKLEKLVEKEEPKKKRLSYLKRGALALGIGVTIALGIFTAVELSNTISAYNVAQSEYSVNVATLMQKIASVDSGNKMAELVETFPDEVMRPSDFEEQSNWFDRLCNFLSGVIGG